MKNCIRLLIVEDDKTEKATWLNQIEQHNAMAEDNDGFLLACVFAETKDTALKLIIDSDFDAAIVDLGLATNEGFKDANSDGNDVVAALENSELAVVVIYTGQPNDAMPTGSKVTVIPKAGVDGDGTKKVMTLLTESAPMILTIREAEETIKREMAAMFSKSIWPRWKFWLADKTHPDQEVSAAISRHLASHVYATLLEKGEHKVLPEEWYFMPPIRDGLRTGDFVEMKNIIAESSELVIVVTPRCDLSNSTSKNETYQLALCEDVSQEWTKRSTAYQEAISQQQRDVENKDAKKALDTAKNRIRGFTQHKNNTNSCHFLPEIKMANGSTRGPFFVRFDKVYSFDRDSSEGQKLKDVIRLASITPEFLPSMVERLGTYFSRIGTPDYSFSE